MANFSSCQINNYSPGYDFALFRNTPVNSLAKAVEEQDTIEIQKLVNNNNFDVNFQEPRFGNTLLLLALINNRRFSAEKLLNLGANPNLRSFDNSSPFLETCFNATEIEKPGEILQMLINHGADVNSIQQDTTLDQFGKTKYYKASALRLACLYGNLETVKTLVENGASITSYGNNEDAILSSAILSRKLDIAKYLMIDKHAPLPEYCVVRQPGMKSERKMTIADMLNEYDFKNNPPMNKLKVEILSYLRNKGKS